MNRNVLMSLSACLMSMGSLISQTNCSGYDADQTTNTMVSGDFDNDGTEDDQAAFYDYGSYNTKIHVWENGREYQGGNGWWSSNGYKFSRIEGTVVSGDFDSDGYKDDIAAFYDYGNSQTRIHVWIGNGSSFSYQGSSGWWSTTGYNQPAIKFRVVAGDFDKDGKEDDIAAMYDYPGSAARIHVWKGTGSSFQYQNSNGWWSVSSGYNPSKINGRMVSGDFDSDGKKDDIAAVYDYGSAGIRVHVWKTNSGNSFSYGHWYVANDLQASSIGSNVVAGNFVYNNNNKSNSEITILYTSSNETKIRTLKPSGGQFSSNSLIAHGTDLSFDFDLNSISGRIVSGNVNDFINIDTGSGIIGDNNLDELISLQDHGVVTGKVAAEINIWHNFEGNFGEFWGDPARGWSTFCTKSMEIEVNENPIINSVSTDLSVEINSYPNPISDNFKVEINSSEEGVLYIGDITGKILFQENIKAGKSLIRLNSREWKSGMYFLNLIVDGQSFGSKLIK